VQRLLLTDLWALPALASLCFAMSCDGRFDILAAAHGWIRGIWRGSPLTHRDCQQIVVYFCWHRRVRGGASGCRHRTIVFTTGTRQRRFRVVLGSEAQFQTNPLLHAGVTGVSGTANGVLAQPHSVFTRGESASSTAVLTLSISTEGCLYWNPLVEAASPAGSSHVEYACAVVPARWQGHLPHTGRDSTIQRCCSLGGIGFLRSDGFPCFFMLVMAPHQCHESFASMSPPFTPVSTHHAVLFG